MRYPLRNLVYEKLKELQHTTDVELLNLLNKDGAAITMRDLNKALLHLEILGLVTVRWVGKDRRRVELAPQKIEEPA